jgi:hypothetical protein
MAHGKIPSDNSNNGRIKYSGNYIQLEKLDTSSRNIRERKIKQHEQRFRQEKENNKTLHGLVAWCQHKNTKLEKNDFF